MFNLRTYLQRIGFNHAPRADLTTLRTLQTLHVANIAFENLDVLMGKDIPLELNKISNKLLTQQRGGYCFEHNSIMMAVMGELGFEVEPLMARAVWQAPVDAPAGPRTHMVLRVNIDDTSWLVDVGFGGLVPTAPLQINTNLKQPTQHESFCLTECVIGWLLQVEIDQQWQPLYHIGPEPQQPVDIEVANWYTSTHPKSKFRNNLIAARTTEDTRYTLLNNRLSIREKGKEVIRKELDIDELMSALQDCFLLEVQPEWRSILLRLIG